MRIFGDIFGGGKNTARPPLQLDAAPEHVSAAAPRYGDRMELSRWDESHYSIMGGGQTAAGPPVNPHLALRFAAAFAAIGLISDTVAQVPCHLLRRFVNPAGRRQTVHATDHPLYDLLHNAPNERMGSFTYRQTIQGHTLGWGNGYSEIERTNGGDPIALWPLLPDNTAPEVVNGVLRYNTNIDGRSFTLRADNVLHISGLGFDGITGYSPLRMAREAIALGLAAERFGASFFGNDAKSGGFLLHPGKLGDVGKKNIRDSMAEQGGLDNAHRVKVLEEGMKWIQTTIAPDDAQFLATREMQIAEIARIYRVPLVLLQSMEKTSSWGSGIEQLMIAFLSLTISPWAIRWESEMNRKLLTLAERKAGYFFKLNLNGLARGDMAARAAFFKSGIDDGWMDPNEARELEDMDARPGLDRTRFPLNQGFIDPVTGEPIRPPQAANTNTPEPAE